MSFTIKGSEYYCDGCASVVRLYHFMGDTPTIRELSESHECSAYVKPVVTVTPEEKRTKADFTARTKPYEQKAHTSDSRELPSCTGRTATGAQCSRNAMTEEDVLRWIKPMQVRLRPHIGRLCVQHAKGAL